MPVPASQAFINPQGQLMPVGTPLPVAIPPEIGSVVRIDPDVHHVYRGVRVNTLIGGLIGAIFVIVTAGILFLVWNLLFGQITRTDRQLMEGTLVAIGLLDAICAFGVWKAFRGEQIAGYVGQQGIAIYTLVRSTGRITKSRLLRFADATELYVERTNVRVNFSDVGTRCRHLWIAGEEFIFDSTYSGADPPTGHNPYCFAQSAERVWNAIAIRRAQEHLKVHGSLTFKVRGIDAIRVSYQLLEIQLHGRSQRIAKSEVAEYRLAKGVFYIRHKDARWFGNAGKFQLEYALMGNAQVFLYALDGMMGMRPS